MKLFKEISRESGIDYMKGSDGEEWEEPYTKIKLELIPETVEHLMNENKGGDVIERIRELIAHMYNSNFPLNDLFGLMRKTDDNHAELIVNIIESCSLKYGDSCFLMIDDLAPKIINKFNLQIPESEL